MLLGTPRADDIHAFAGSDRVYARSGDDPVRAGVGNDLVVQATAATSSTRVTGTTP